MEWGVIITWTLIWAIIGYAVGVRKGEQWTGAILAVMFGPIGVLVVAFMRGNRMDCPFCKSTIRKDASICPYCRNGIPEEPPVIAR